MYINSSTTYFIKKHSIYQPNSIDVVFTTLRALRKLSYKIFGDKKCPLFPNYLRKSKLEDIFYNKKSLIIILSLILNWIDYKVEITSLIWVNKSVLQG